MPTAFISGDQKDKNVIRGVINGQYKIVFFIPEITVLKRKWRELLSSPIYAEKLHVVVIDEAHTVKQWGETFRRTMLRICEVRSLVPASVHMLALTATATRAVREEVSKILGMRNPVIVAVSPCKRNMAYCVCKSDTIKEAFSTLIDKLRTLRCRFPRTIIYCQKFLTVECYTTCLKR